MYNIDEAYFDVFNEIETEFGEVERLISSVEVMSDNKLYNFYLKKYKKIENCANAIRQFNDAFKYCENNEKTNPEQNEKIEQLFLKAKSEYINLKSSAKEQVLIELTSSDNTLLSEMEDVFLSFSKVNESEFKIVDKSQQNVKIQLEGLDVYKLTNAFCGKIKKIMCGKESSLVLSAIKTQTYADELNLDDVVIQYSKSSGAGGQHINKTESAVRVVHLPTGISAECQDERSQIKNKEKALKNLQEKITQNNKKNNKINAENQRKNIQNLIFSDTPSVILNFDTNEFLITSTKKKYKLKEILNGNLKLIFEDTSIYG